MRPALRPLPELVAALEAGEVSSRELVEDCLARIGQWNERWNVFLHVAAESACVEADAADARRASGQALGALDGVPYALKDNIVTEDLPTTCGSRILEGFRSPYDAEVVVRLRASGAVLLGKLNLDEFAMGSSNEHSAFGPVRNPHDPERVPGGSSGGSCAAVAAGMTPLAFGSDTGGSVRLPAAYCGVAGLKPTYGRVSRRGLVAFGSSLDQIGPVARTVTGCALAFDAIAGPDPGDATSRPDDAPAGSTPGTFAASVDGASESAGGIRVGVLRELLGEGVDPEVAEATGRAIEALRDSGATIVDVALPHARYGVAAYYVVSSAEASSNLARFDGARYGRRAEGVSDLEELYTKSRSEGFGDEVKRRIMIGTFTLSAGYFDAYYASAMKARSLIRDDYEAAFEAADVLISPVCPTPAFPLGARLDDPLAMYLTDVMTIPANLAGIPAISVPFGTTGSGLPLAVQLQAPALGEGTLFRAAAFLERRAGGVPVPALVAEGAA